MAKLGARICPARFYKLTHLVIRCDFPPDNKWIRWHSAAIERVGCQSRPEHDSIGQRIARSHPECERIVGEVGQTRLRLRPESAGHRQTRKRGCPDQKAAT